MDEKEPLVTHAEFVAAAARPADLPPSDVAEVAFGGRSNVGKSSLLNLLLQRRKLVRTSKTPGMTRTLNIFSVGLHDGTKLSFADLPGYGFAQVSRSERVSWGPMVEGYLEERTALRALAVLVDIRRGIQKEEEELFEFWDSIAKGRPLIVVATKVDKLPRNRQAAAVSAMSKAAKKPVFGTSATDAFGRSALWRALLEAIRQPP